MNQLFVDLYLDEDVNVLIADLVRARGFRVTTTQAAGQVGTTDASQLAFATSQGKALLTHNRVHFWRKHILRKRKLTTELSSRFAGPPKNYRGAF